MDCVCVFRVLCVFVCLELCVCGGEGGGLRMYVCVCVCMCVCVSVCVRKRSAVSRVGGALKEGERTLGLILERFLKIGRAWCVLSLCGGVCMCVGVSVCVRKRSAVSRVGGALKEGERTLGLILERFL